MGLKLLPRCEQALCGMAGCVSGKPSKINFMAYKLAQSGEPEDAFP
jgi:hypothetical protein